MSDKILKKSGFLEAVKNHSVEILNDNGIHRHLKFTNDGSFHQRFELITWPGYLCYCGDMGSFLFKYYDIDMLTFFRRQHIMPMYWAEKLQSVDVLGGYEKFTEEALKEAVFAEIEDQFKEHASEESWGLGLSEKEHGDLEKQVIDDIENEIINWQDGRGEEGARQAVYDYSGTFEYIDSDGEEQTLDFAFGEEWQESRLREYTLRYIWCLYAIVWGIQQYDKAKKVTE